MAHPLDLIQLKGGRRVPLIRQTEAAECGLACLAMVASFHGHQTDLTTLRRQFAISLKGATLKTLIGIADDLGFNGRPLRGEPEELGEIALPAILHWDLNHFVVLARVERSLRGTRYHVHNPALGEEVLTEAELSRHFTGVVLELTPSERFQRKTERAPLRITQLWTRIVGLQATLVQVGFLSLLLQLFAFAGPFYLQLAVDTAIPTFDTDFLLALAAGFAGITVLNLTTSTLREVILLKLGSTLGYQLVANLFRQLVRLPMGYFEKRHTGDVISRFESTQPITDMLSHGLIQALVDGIMALGTLGLMLYYSPVLAGIALGALAISILAQVLYFGALRLANANVIAARAAESSTMIETVRGMAAIKLFAREGDRQRFWQNKRAAVVNAQIRMGRMQVWFNAATGAVMGLENILFVYLAVKMTIAAQFTVGMIFAFQSYKGQFLGAANRLVQQWVQFRLLDVHLTRIADIALTPAEPQPRAMASQFQPSFRGEIELRDVHFSYGYGEKPVLSGVNLKIAAGETVALVGPSGGGKTTLMKLMLGFYPPTKGEILIDGEPLHQFGLQRYRRQIGAVLQEDVLYAGSLAENIAFFDAELDMERVIEVARLACIHDEIMAMPMGFESLVGDMGSTLSGGQKQRVLLARALYAEPKVLFLDEGTAHLDPPTECAVHASLRKSRTTKINIVHNRHSKFDFSHAYLVNEGRINSFNHDFNC
ncbi:peptidase domain-containing ABC transporter [Novosphingobium sp.]|uniref:peptidase domain-containing ABC transporter n=1 Tax=Novosphingobium sp. TaxID=1874826 RepID=UPI00261B9B88|nr:peptidase domain-containing ABC transporter [Novosphingobium sp.]